MRVVLILLLAAGCSSDRDTPRPLPGGDGSVPGRDGGVLPGFDAGPACAGEVSGLVRFPNGIQPVPGALVYVPAADGPAPRSGECGQCIAAGSTVALAETAVDGTFTLRGIPQGMRRLVIEKGKFRRTIDLNLSECGARVALDEEATRLPRNTTEGEIPRIAVGTGDFDSMQIVVAKIGLGELSAEGALVPGSEQFDLYEGSSFGFGSTYPGLDALLRDLPRMQGYDVIFVNCGSGPEQGDIFTGDSILDEPAVRENIRQYVEGGGRFYVTDEAYDYVEQALPRFIGFENGFGPETAGLSETPEEEDSAEIGNDMEFANGTVHDDALRAWLGQVGALQPDTTVRITGIIAGWTVMHETDAMRTKTWVSGDVVWISDDGFSDERGNRPLTVTFDYGCGRVLYTSYHTAEFSLFGGGDPRALTPQELILAYLTLEIGTCIEDPILI